MKISTWADLKEFANQLDEDQLTQTVRWWGDDEEGGPIKGVDIINDDMINPTGDGLEPRCAYSDDPEYDNEPAFLLKGTIMLEGDLKYPSY